MEVDFKNNELREQYRDHKLAERAHGVQVARKYIQRINIIKSVKDIEELKRLPGLRCHPLKGDRKGEWAINLTGFYRLIFTLRGEELRTALIEEVSKHYDD